MRMAPHYLSPAQKTSGPEPIFRALGKRGRNFSRQGPPWSAAGRAKSFLLKTLREPFCVIRSGAPWVQSIKDKQFRVAYRGRPRGLGKIPVSLIQPIMMVVNHFKAQTDIELLNDAAFCQKRSSKRRRPAWEVAPVGRGKKGKLLGYDRDREIKWTQEAFPQLEGDASCGFT